MTGIKIDTNPAASLPFGPWLKQRRRALDLTQAELARRSSCGTESIRKIESGALKPSRALALQIALALLVPVAEHDTFVAFARTAHQTAAAGAFSAAPPRDSHGPAPAHETVHSGALPHPLTSFVGRIREIQAAVTLMRRPDVSLVTLSGPPGAGKTRLSLAIAEQLGADFGDGVYFVPLAAIQDPALVLPAIAQALGLEEAANEPSVQTVKRYLRGRRVLIILDNFEQVVAAGPVVTEVLATAPHTKVLVSSRAVLKVYGEHEFPVPSLPVPSLVPLPSLETLAAYASVQLFMLRAETVRAGLTLNTANAEAIAGICIALDGLPLAIEMAAARMKWSEPAVLLQKLRRHLSSLANDVRNLPPRQQTLRGAIDWSYDLLNASEQRVLNWLSVFVGGCTLEAAQGVIGDSGAEPLLESLVEKSLVQITSQAREAARFTLLEMVRDYAREKLEAAGEVALARDQHLDWFMRWVELGAPKVIGAEQAAWYRLLDAEHANLRAAADWAIERRLSNQGMRLASPLLEFWIERGHQHEWLERLTRLLQLPEAVPAQLRIKTLQGAAFTHWQQKNFAAARLLLHEALALDPLRDDSRSRAISLRYLGLVASGEQDVEGARNWFEQSLETLRKLDDRFEVAWSLAMLGDMALRVGDGPRSESMYAESAALLLQLGNKTLRAYVLRRLGDVSLARSDTTAAALLYRESLTFNTELHDRRAMAACLVGLANVSLASAHAADGVRLLGAVAAVLDTLTAAFLPPDQAEYERSVTSLRSSMDTASFEDAWRSGRELTLDQAVAFALASTG